jgi:hypothetical protein
MNPGRNSDKTCDPRAVMPEAPLANTPPACKEGRVGYSGAPRGAPETDDEVLGSALD